LRDFLAERFFVVSILVSTKGLSRKCCPTQRAADGWESERFWGFGPELGWIPFFNPLSPSRRLRRPFGAYDRHMELYGINIKTTY
jgi:hypothetical protein